MTTPKPPPTHALAAADRLFSLAPHLADLMERGLAERGLTLARAKVLWALDEGGPVVQRQLGQSLGVSARYVTELVDALEADRLVVRRPHPTDRRARLVALTRRGKAAASQMRSEREDFARLLFGDIEPTELPGLVVALDRVIARLESLEAE